MKNTQEGVFLYDNTFPSSFATENVFILQLKRNYLKEVQNIISISTLIVRTFYQKLIACYNEMCLRDVFCPTIFPLLVPLSSSVWKVKQMSESGTQRQDFHPPQR